MPPFALPFSRQGRKTQNVGVGFNHYNFCTQRRELAEVGVIDIRPPGLTEAKLKNKSLYQPNYCLAKP